VACRAVGLAELPHPARTRLDPSSEQAVSAMWEGRVIPVMTPQSARRLEDGAAAREEQPGQESAVS
jgi:hypothetical protein